MYSEQDLKELIAPYEARIAELQEQCDELKQSRIRLKQETDAFVEARIKVLEKQAKAGRVWEAHYNAARQRIAELERELLLIQMPEQS
jgi:predicted RNase H-like nuclease (RuvC/YqgF family)